MKLSEYVKSYRKKHGLSLRAMAEKCNCSFQYLAKLEAEEIDNPSLEKVRGIANATGISVHELLTTLEDFPVNISTNDEIRERLELLQLRIDPKAREHDALISAFDESDEKIQNAVRLLLGLNEK